MAYEVILNQPSRHRILLEEAPEGVYVNVFDSPNAPGPYIDQLQDDLEMAMRDCEQEYGVRKEQWVQVPDEIWH